MKHSGKLLKQGLFRRDQLNYVERTATINNIDLDKMTLPELIEFCEAHVRIFVNKESPPDDTFNTMLKNSKWKLDKPQEPKPL